MMNGGPNTPLFIVCPEDALKDSAEATQKKDGK
jgi:hypothetical protein